MPNNGMTELSVDVISARAQLLKKLRDFMFEKGVLEVETPYLSQASNPDPNITNLQLGFRARSHNNWYLHSSPEFPMKRLLASGVGSIYQICRVFRDDESGHQHNPEFTMLEYYRIGFDQFELMDEVSDLLFELGFEKASRKSYRECFIEYVGLDPWEIETDVLINKSKQKGYIDSDYSRASCLDFLFGTLVTSNLGHEQPCFIYDYPYEQAALAKIRDQGDYKISERFEVFINGMEIGNAYYELNDAEELKQRFAKDIEYCKQNQLAYGPVDKNLLNTTDELPDCSGIAIGIDRLLMALLKLDSINKVLCFPFNQA